MNRSVIVLGLAAASLARADQAGSDAAVPVETERLANGLTVVIAPDPTASSVVVHVRYRGGVADETERERGFTHLVEKLLFTGSVHVKPGDYDARIDAAGGFTGSTTSGDQLAVYEQVPAGALELAMWLEAERMAGLADGITDARLATARDAIAAEYTSAYVDEPYALAARAVQHGLWPGETRYHADALVDGAVLATATRDRVGAFVRERIRPARATLVIAGRVNAFTARALARRYFAWIPDTASAPANDVPSAESIEPLVASTTVAIDDSVDRVVVAYRLPAPREPDFLVLEVAARMLAGGRGTRLYDALVETGEAADVSIEIVRFARAGELRITATPKHGSLDALRVDILREVAALGREQLVERDLERATATYETDQLIALEGLVYRADALARWYTVERADTLRTLPSRLRAISPLLLQRVVARWLADTAYVAVMGKPRP